MPAGFFDSCVVQVHPTLRCNLSCAHCYSSSSPRERGELPPDTLIRRLERLRREGFDVVSFSGGEPLMYGGFDEVAAAAVAMGFRVTMITNGLLLTERRIDVLQGVLSLVGVSLDGAPHRHDRLRGVSGAFDKLERRLRMLRDRNVTFGLSHCVTRESIEDLPWLIDYAIEHGAALVQMHPLTMAGRATETCRGLALSDADLGRVFLIAELQRIQTDRQLAIQVDIAAATQLRAHRRRLALLDDDAPPSLVARQLAEFVNPVVMDERGQLLPLAYGIATEQSLTEHPYLDWDRALDAYKATGASALRDLLTDAFESIEREAPRFLDWYGYLVALSRARVGTAAPSRIHILPALLSHPATPT